MISDAMMAARMETARAFYAAYDARVFGIRGDPSS